MYVNSKGGRHTLVMTVCCMFPTATPAHARTKTPEIDVRNLGVLEVEVKEGAEGM